MLTFPEVLDRDRLETLEEMCAPLEKFFAESVDSKKIDLEASIPPETLQVCAQRFFFSFKFMNEGEDRLSSTKWPTLIGSTEPYHLVRFDYFNSSIRIFPYYCV